MKILTLLLFVFTLKAEIILPSIISDNMLLNQKKAPIWGKAEASATITISFNKKEYETKADKEGNFKIVLQDLARLDSAELIIKENSINQITIKNVAVGDVWLASGQSNMRWVYNKSSRVKEDKNIFDNKNIRFFRIEQNFSRTPLTNIEGQWQVVSAQNIGNFSACALYFAYYLHKGTKKNIGIVQSAYGGTPVGAWIPVSSFNDDDADMNKYKSTLKRKVHKKGVCFNAMIKALIPYGIKGVIWYQGEADASLFTRSKYYAKMYELMVKSWRKLWENETLPFYHVQLANFKGKTYKKNDKVIDIWPLLREEQNKTLKIPHTGQALAIDIGNRDDIHPKNKREVGRRLSLIALAKNYNKKVEYKNPIYVSHLIKNNTISIKTSDKLIHSGIINLRLHLSDETVMTIKAKLANDTLIIEYDNLDKVQAVSYAWKNNPEITLHNGHKLPLRPFKITLK